jgi:hypothetical protein
MKLYLFRSLMRPELFGFTDDATGKKLPAERAPWEAVSIRRTEQNDSHEEFVALERSKEIVGAIRRDGYCLAESLTSIFPLCNATGGSKPGLERSLQLVT